MIEKLVIPTPDGVCDAWIASPSAQGSYPGLIFVPDAIGPRANLKQMAETLAQAGYVVLLPKIFYRDRPAPLFTGIVLPAQPSDMPELFEQIMPLVMKFNVDKAVSDIRLVIDALEARPNVKKGKLGIFGYCMGGALALRAAAQYPNRFAAVASFHAGGLVTDGDDSPHKILLRIRAAIYVGHADQDPHMSADQIKAFEVALASVSTPHESELYVGAKHHFTMADLPDHDPTAAKKHWGRLLQLFKKTL